jgi:hypothetical protein
LKKLRETIKAHFVDKGDVKEHMAQLEVLDYHGNYEKNKHFVGSLGG